MDSMATHAWQTEENETCKFIEAVVLWLSSLSCHCCLGSHTIFESVFNQCASQQGICSCFAIDQEKI